MKEQILAVQRMQDYIELHQAEEISLSALAQASLFSPWYSYRLFRACLGLTPTEYIRKYRLTQAAKQLRGGAVKVIEDRYDPQEFYTAVQGLENEPERGGRCTVCYRLRMRRAAQYAKEHGFDWFTTTLSISPHKDAARINQIGQELEAEFGIRHLPSDFKKQNGYLRSLQLSEEYGLYRQDYCGCEFSAKARG